MILFEGVPFRFRVFNSPMPQRLNFSFNSSKFASDLFFKVGFSPVTSSEESKNRLKSPTKMNRLFRFKSNLSRSSNRLIRILTCSASVLTLYKFINI